MKDVMLYVGLIIWLVGGIAGVILGLSMGIIALIAIIFGVFALGAFFFCLFTILDNEDIIYRDVLMKGQIQNLKR